MQLSPRDIFAEKKAAWAGPAAMWDLPVS
jgi:hypothetical protein